MTETIRSRIEAASKEHGSDIGWALIEQWKANNLIPRDEHEAVVTTARREGMEQAAVICERPTIKSCCCAEGIAAAIRADKGAGE